MADHPRPVSPTAASYHAVGSDAHIQVRDAVGAFTIELVKSIFQTSAYQVRHPLTMALVDQLFLQFEPLRKHFYRLNYLALEDSAQRDIQLEGLFVEPVLLSRCIRGVMRDDFVAKLWDFFQWNRLVSFSLSGDLTRDQFITFLEMTARSFAGRKHSPATAPPGEHRLAQLLAQQNVVTISVVAQEEIIVADRSVSWRVKLALSRLRKNIRDIPLYTTATNREIHDVKRQLLREVIHPLRVAPLLMELILNCDLLASEWTGFADVDLEEEVIGVLSRSQLQGVTGALLRVLSSTQATAATLLKHNRVRALLRICFRRMAQPLDDDAHGLFQEALRAGLITLDDLPESVWAAFQVDTLTEDFLADPGRKIAEIESIRTAADVAAHAGNAPFLVAELIARKQYRWARRIVSTLDQRLRAPTVLPDAKRMIGDHVATISRTPGFQHMMLHFPSLAQSDHTDVRFFCQLFPEDTVPSLISELRDSTRPATRAGICQVLEVLGPTALPAIRGALQETNPPALYRDLLKVLTAIRDSGDFALSRTFICHDDAAVRAAALQAIIAIGGIAADPDLLRALAGPELPVKQIALEQLGEFGSRDPRFVAFIAALIGEEMTTPTKGRRGGFFGGQDDTSDIADLALYTSGCKALRTLVKKRKVDASNLEPALINVLGRQLKASTKGSEDRLHARARLMVGIIFLLGDIGSARSAPVIKQAKRHDFRDVRQAALSALATNPTLA